MLAAGLVLFCSACAAGTPTANTDGQAPEGAPTPDGSAQPGRTARSNPELIAYEFPEGALQTFPGAAVEDLPVSRVGGVLSLPEGDGPFPVAVLIHGSYPNCVDAPNDPVINASAQSISPWPRWCGALERVHNYASSQGPDYVKWDLAFAGFSRALAERGVAALSIDVSLKDSLAFGEQGQSVITRNLYDLHLSLLQDFNAGNLRGLSLPERIEGSLDLSKIALIGHSSGGGFVFDEFVADQPIPNVKAVVGLQPVLYVEQDATPYARQVPALIIASSCDEQVPFDSVEEAAAMLANRNAQAPVFLAQMEGTTHIAFVGGGNHKIGLVTPVETPECADDRLYQAPSVRSQAAGLAAEFVEQALAGTSEYQFSIGTAVPSSVRALNDSATATTQQVRDSSLPRDVSAASLAIQRSDERVLPESDRMPNAGGGE